ncbi:MAG: PTS lactose/cellobiose transporter subunit IIA [Schleiferilactobacillus harbinensis]|jgi:PTS system cellobiose-specific IIA component|nr:PTS lactose/cellobiose transporter subunit IIA [Schleiferilactobacillus harbinensis]MCI1911413.1 PTS lactose/cellobiose transporter subunit IIA [Schleiferilactobacillus harbinensis]
MLDKEYNDETENIAMEIIAHSGDGRSLAFEALKAAREGDHQKAENLLAQSNREINKAHNVQSQMLVDEANGKQTDFSILLIHSQDHFMASMLANELISEMVRMYQTFEGGKQG